MAGSPGIQTSGRVFPRVSNRKHRDTEGPARGHTGSSHSKAHGLLAAALSVRGGGDCRVPCGITRKFYQEERAQAPAADDEVASEIRGPVLKGLEFQGEGFGFGLEALEGILGECNSDERQGDRW